MRKRMHNDINWSPSPVVELISYIRSIWSTALVLFVMMPVCVRAIFRGLEVERGMGSTHNPKA
jgi:hypothetical protein